MHALTRNAAGATTALSSTTGVSWSLTVDGANRVSTLTLPERTVGYAYGGHGKVATMTVADSVSGTTRVRSYDYDAQGRLVAVSGGGADATVDYAAGTVRIDDGGEVFEYEVDERGRVAWVQQGADPEVRVERDQAGDVVEISQGHRSVRFGRDDLGRIVEAAFADGSSARYFYDELGNRSLAEHGDGRVVEYAYDAAGSLTGVQATARDGTVSLEMETTPILWSIVERIEQAAAGHWSVFDAGHQSIPLDRRRNGVLSMPTGESPSLEPGSGTAGGAARATPATRLAVLMGDGVLPSPPDYDALSFGRSLGTVGRHPIESRIPLLTDARAMLAEAQRRVRGGGAGRFDESSNLVFRSALLHRDEFARNIAQSATRATCEPCDPPAYAEIAGATGVTYQVRNYQHQTPTAVNWGQFQTNRTIGLDVGIKAHYVARSRTWQPKVVTARSRYDIWWGHTLAEATAANATASNCAQTIEDLTQGSVPQTYYSTESLKAHEYAHLADWETSLNQEFAALVQAIEALSVAHSCGMDQSGAENALTALPGLKSERIGAFNRAESTFANFMETNADAAGQAVKDRIIGEIKAKGDQNAWPQACRN